MSHRRWYILLASSFFANICIPQGWLWSRLPLTATNFIIELEFKVCGIPSPDIYCLSSCWQISGSDSRLYGDGLALWLTTERAQPGPVFGSKGEQHNRVSSNQGRWKKSSDHFTGLGIFLDTCGFCTSIYNEALLTVSHGIDTKMIFTPTTHSRVSLPCRAMGRRVMILPKMVCRI
jgi:Legume-like lectin family